MQSAALGLGFGHVARSAPQFRAAQLLLARYHADALLRILAQNPRDRLDEPLRVPLEAHLEGLADTGTAAAEKTFRSLDPDAIPDRA